MSPRVAFCAGWGSRMTDRYLNRFGLDLLSPAGSPLRSEP